MSKDASSRATQRVLDIQARGATHQEQHGCLRKVTYLTRRLAKQSARQLNRGLVAYHCPHCALFHLTKKANERRKRAARDAQQTPGHAQARVNQPGDHEP